MGMLSGLIAQRDEERVGLPLLIGFGAARGKGKLT